MPARPEPTIWRLRGRVIELTRPRLMGVVNVTPDSFSDGGAFASVPAAVLQAEKLVREGADLLDVGGESTRPGADPVPVEEELRRVIPVIREASDLGVPVSVDTRRSAVARQALEAGAAAVNDVGALGDPDMAGVVAAAGAGIVLMHMRGEPRTMQADPRYEDVVGEVAAFLGERRDRAESGGIPRESIVLDPGIGFGKTLEHNLALLRGLETLIALGSPVLVGVSRKRFLGALSGEEDPRRRLPGSLAAVLAARARGAAIFRVHDVAETRQALAVFEAI